MYWPVRVAGVDAAPSRTVDEVQDVIARLLRQTRLDGRMQIEPSSQPKQAISESVALLRIVPKLGSSEASKEEGGLQTL